MDGSVNSNESIGNSNSMGASNNSGGGVNTSGGIRDLVKQVKRSLLAPLSTGFEDTDEVNNENESSASRNYKVTHEKYKYPHNIPTPHSFVIPPNICEEVPDVDISASNVVSNV